MIVEICANSFESARNAQEAGADRIELCAELGVGGTTPTYGLLKKIKEELTIEVSVLLRPRSGNFTYSSAEFDILKKDIELCKELGCEGIVAGVLNADNTLDVERTKELIELSKPLHFTFHRALDWVPDVHETMQQLITLGCDRVLTSGQQPKAILGIDLLTSLHQQYGEKITIMPGSGINEENILKFKERGFKEIHFSASKPVHVLDTEPRISFSGGQQDEKTVPVSNLEIIKRMVKSVK
ncbi:copper homeostasis protein [Zhouia amylolytica]|uniref:PF03932 family protein CutC n=1 Tax=Zhouia amylolytica TaxID=376730 RepID=A0A1I6VDY5_9FLAO|nr:copper homeostasis protein CutC [Zhouia amylolytica]SFT11895.1 copper homeostasis protein [Zhouia amylolytica]